MYAYYAFIIGLYACIWTFVKRVLGTPRKLMYCVCRPMNMCVLYCIYQFL